MKRLRHRHLLTGMKHWSAVTIALLLATLTAFSDLHEASSQTSTGWVMLFDGKNLNQWDTTVTPNVSYRVEDGAVVAHKKISTKSAYLVSKGKYKNFQLYAEFWVSADANSGIFIRCENPKRPSAKTCYECNISDKRPSYGTGAIVYHAEVNPMPKGGGKWSTMVITANGRDLTVTFDGRKTAQAHSDLHTEGPIALQFGMGTVKFLTVAIKTL